MNKNWKAQVSLGVVFMILAFLITVQFRSVTKNNEVKQQNSVRLDELLVELKNERAKTEDLRKQIESYKNDIDQYREDAETSSGYSKFLSEQLKRAELMAGFVDVKGPGVVVTLNDINIRKNTPILDANSSLIHEKDIRDVINELKAAGAEAISINDNRIISTSAVRCAGPTILANDVKMAPPYVIKAVGKPEQLEASLNLNGGVVDILTVLGFEVSISKQENITIAKYSGAFNFKYATAVEAKEEKKE